MHNDLITKINKVFPELEWKKTKFITSGWDHNILLLDNNLVVRMPKNNDAKKRIMVDFCLLTHLQNKIDANIPIPFLKDVKSKIVIYKAVNGTTLSEDQYKKLSQSEKAKFAKHISTFLSQLHKTSINNASKCGIPKKNIIDINREVIHNAKLIYSHLSHQEKNSLDNFIKRRKEILKENKPRLIHGDLTSENIFFNKNNTNKIGIIDFSDAVIDDPARDFSALFSYGDQFVTEVIKSYDVTPKKKIFERGLIYYQEMAITLLAWAIRGSTLISLKDAKKIFNHRLK